MSEWQTIETAPLDTTPILGYFNSRIRGEEGEYKIIQYYAHWNGDDEWAWVTSNNEVCRVPDYWMPLTPPEGEI